MDLILYIIEHLYKKLYLNMVKSNTYKFDTEYLTNQFIIEYPSFKSCRAVLYILAPIIKITHEKSNNIDLFENYPMILGLSKPNFIINSNKSDSISFDNQIDESGQTALITALLLSKQLFTVNDNENDIDKSSFADVD